MGSIKFSLSTTVNSTGISSGCFRKAGRSGTTIAQSRTKPCSVHDQRSEKGVMGPGMKDVKKRGGGLFSKRNKGHLGDFNFIEQFDNCHDLAVVEAFIGAHKHGGLCIVCRKIA